MSTQHLNVVVSCSTVEGELVADRLWSLGALAIEERSVGASTEFWTSLGEDVNVVTRVMESSGLVWRLEQVDASVADSWRQFAEPVVVDGSLRIVPAWWAGEAVPGVLDIRIEPGSTFGLGNHPTTLGCARMLRRLPMAGRSVLDVGTGSGVLAIASVLLGAGRAHGIDINPASPQVVTGNASINGVLSSVTVSTEPLTYVPGPYDVVLANILAPVLIDLAPELLRLTSGVLVVSGLLESAYEHVVSALAPLAIRDRVVIDGWITLALGR